MLGKPGVSSPCRVPEENDLALDGADVGRKPCGYGIFVAVGLHPFRDDARTCGAEFAGLELRISDRISLVRMGEFVVN